MQKGYKIGVFAPGRDSTFANCTDLHALVFDFKAHVIPTCNHFNKPGVSSSKSSAWNVFVFCCRFDLTLLSFPSAERRSIGAIINCAKNYTNPIIAYDADVCGILRVSGVRHKIRIIK